MARRRASGGMITYFHQSCGTEVWEDEQGWREAAGAAHGRTALTDPSIFTSDTAYAQSRLRCSRGGDGHLLEVDARLNGGRVRTQCRSSNRGHSQVRRTRWGISAWKSSIGVEALYGARCLKPRNKDWLPHRVSWNVGGRSWVVVRRSFVLKSCTHLVQLQRRRGGPGYE